MMTCNRSSFVRVGMVHVALAAVGLLQASEVRADALDDVEAFLEREVAGRTMYRETPFTAGAAPVATEHWFVMTGVSRSPDILSYQILYTARYRRASREGGADIVDSIDTETAHFYCRLGRRASTGQVLGYCAPDAATDRPLDGKAWTVIATLEDGKRLVLDESITLYQDSPDPGAPSGQRAASGTSRIVIEEREGRLSMTETAARQWVDPRTLARSPAGPPVTIQSTELRGGGAVWRELPVRTTVPADDPGLRALDAVHAWFRNRIVGRELTWQDPKRGVTSWFTIAGASRGAREMQYDILFRSRRPIVAPAAKPDGTNERGPTPAGNVGAYRMEQVRWACRLGAPRTSDRVTGYCTTLAATDRELTAKVSAMQAEVDGAVLKLRESTVNPIDVVDPASGTRVAGVTSSEIVVSVRPDGKLQMSETSNVYAVDPRTGERRALRTPMTVTMVEQGPPSD